MKSLDSLMGLNSNGVPDEYLQYIDDPMLRSVASGNDQMAMDSMGIPSFDNPYDLVGMSKPESVDQSSLLTKQLLGGAVPQLSQNEINSLAQALGLRSDNTDPMVDPMYSQQFDIMSLLGGR